MRREGVKEILMAAAKGLVVMVMPTAAVMATLTAAVKGWVVTTAVGRVGAVMAAVRRPRRTRHQKSPPSHS